VVIGKGMRDRDIKKSKEKLKNPNLVGE